MKESMNESMNDRCGISKSLDARCIMTVVGTETEGTNSGQSMPIAVAAKVLGLVFHLYAAFCAHNLIFIVALEVGVIGNGAE